MKKISTLLLILILGITSLVGCGNSNEMVATSGKSKEKIILRMSTQHPTEHMAHKSALEIKEKVEKETNGRIEIQIYPSNQLGDYVQVYEEIMRGSIDIAHITIPDQFDGRLGVGFLPYLASNYDEIRKVFAKDSFLSTEISKIHEELGVKFLGYYAEGFAGVGTVKMPNEIDDVNADHGVLIRVPPLDVFKFGAEALGYRTTTIPWSETYTALQTGIADGWYAGPPNLQYQVMRDVIKQYIHYREDQECTQYVMNGKTFNSLTSEDQKIIEDAFAEQAEKSTTLAEEEDAMYMEKLKELGIEVIEFSDEELKDIAEEVRTKSWPKLEENLTKELLDGIKADMGY